MRSAAPAFIALLACCSVLLAQPKATPDEEVLNYSVNYPSGLSLGEARLESKKTKAPDGGSDGWELLFTLGASIPGFEVADKFRSVATAGYCSVEFEKDSKHGKSVTRELATFDQKAGSVTRRTVGGGQSQLQISGCAKDALAFLNYFRREVDAGRVPPAQAVYFGGPYQVRLEYAGRQRLTVGDERMDTDRIRVSVKGKASDITFEVFLSLDAGRRPVLVRVPLMPGTFSMELVP